MEFDKSRVFSAVNADELKAGSKCIFANTMQDLKAFVKTKSPATLTSIGDESSPKRFMGLYGYAEVAYLFAYLIEPPGKPKYKPFESVDKAMEAIKAHGGWIKWKSDNIQGVVIGRSSDRIKILQDWVLLKDMFNDYVFADDGSPCGELVEE